MNKTQARAWVEENYTSVDLYKLCEEITEERQVETASPIWLFLRSESKVPLAEVVVALQESLKAYPKAMMQFDEYDVENMYISTEEVVGVETLDQVRERLAEQKYKEEQQHIAKERKKEKDLKTLHQLMEKYEDYLE